MQQPGVWIFAGTFIMKIHLQVNGLKPCGAFQSSADAGAAPCRGMKRLSYTT